MDYRRTFTTVESNGWVAFAKAWTNTKGKKTMGKSEDKDVTEVRKRLLAAEGYDPSGDRLVEPPEQAQKARKAQNRLLEIEGFEDFKPLERLGPPVNCPCVDLPPTGRLEVEHPTMETEYFSRAVAAVNARLKLVDGYIAAARMYYDWDYTRERDVALARIEVELEKAEKQINLLERLTSHDSKPSESGDRTGSAKG